MFQYSILMLSVMVLFFASRSCGQYISYNNCKKKCVINNNCTGMNPLELKNEGFFVNLLWNCTDNCRYHCMWIVVDNDVKNGWKVEKFEGKWPFIRWLGMQEPASVIFSLMNLASTLFMYNKFYKKMYNCPRTSMFWIWCGYTVVACNAWLWSVVFHTRDIMFNEIMDYTSATVLLFYSSFIFIYRILFHQHVIIKFVLVGIASFFTCERVKQLVVKIDYDYNIQLLFTIAGISGLITVIWCIVNVRKLPHTKYIIAHGILLGLSATLEYFDFSAYFWVFDAHSLWHLCTSPLPILLFKFAIEDRNYILTKKKDAPEYSLANTVVP